MAERLNQLIAEGKTSHRKIVAAGGAANGQLGRVRNAEDNVGIDILDRLAEVFGMEPWQLLHPNPDQIPNLPEEIQGIADAIARIPGDLQRAQALARAYRAAFQPGRPEDAPAEVQTTREREEARRG